MLTKATKSKLAVHCIALAKQCGQGVAQNTHPAILASETNGDLERGDCVSSGGFDTTVVSKNI